MSKRTFQHTLEHLLLRGISFVARTLPRPLILTFGSFAGSLMHATGTYRSIVLANMRHCGYWNEEELGMLVPRLYRTMGKYIADFLVCSGKMPPYHFAHNTDLQGAINRGRGTIGVLGHLGNWEVLAEIFGKQVPDLNVIAMPMSNPAVEKWLHERRSKTGVKIIHKHRAVRPTLAALNRNGIVAILIDQHAGTQGTMIPFLGKETSTVRTVAGLHRSTDCSIVIGAAILEKNNHYRILFEVGRDLGISSESEEEFIKAYQIEHNAILSRWIREYPEHYFGWFHKRFRESINYG